MGVVLAKAVNPFVLNCLTRKHANTQTRKHANTQTRKHANTQTRKHANTQTRKHANTQTRKYANTQTRKHANTQTRKHANTQTRKHANTQTRQHANTPTRQHANTPTRQHANTPERLLARDHGIGRVRRGCRPSATKPGGERACAGTLLTWLPCARDRKSEPTRLAGQRSLASARRATPRVPFAGWARSIGFALNEHTQAAGAEPACAGRASSAQPSEIIEQAQSSTHCCAPRLSRALQLRLPLRPHAPPPRLPAEPMALSLHQMR